MTPNPRVIGYGPRGRSYPFAIVVEAQQPGPEGIDLQLIIDDGMVCDYVRFVAADKRRRMVKLQMLDRDRGLRYADLCLPHGSTEVLIECFDTHDHRIDELCCTYNLYACTFAPAQFDDDMVSDGIKSEKGVTLKYQKMGAYNEYETAQKLIKAQDESFFGKAVMALLDLIFLAVRCYLGTVLVYNLGYTKLEHCILAALVFGLVSQRTLGNTVSILIRSTALKVGLLFSPVLIVAYLAVNPMRLKELIYGGTASERLNYWLASIQWTEKAQIEATEWAIVLLIAVWFFLWMFTPDLSEEDESSAGL